MRYLIFIFFSLISIVSIGQDFKGLPFIKYYSPKEYNGGIQNRTITQNKEGVIYVANNFGLLEFDGTSWRKYTVPKQTKLRDVTVNKIGHIYVAAQGDFGYYTAKNNQLEFVSLADSLPAGYRNFDETWEVFTHDNEAIFCTFEKVFIYKDDRLTNIIPLKSESANFFYVNNKLFINNDINGLSTLVGTEIVPFPNGEVFTEKSVTGIIPLIANEYLISTLNSGIYHFNGSQYVPWQKNDFMDFSKLSINTCLRLKNGNLAFGTQNQGLFITNVDGELLLHINKGEGLDNRTILSLHEDNMGNLWIGHNNGLTMVEINLPFSSIGEFSQLPGTGYDGIIFNKHIYLGTNNGLYVKEIDKPDSDYEYVEGTEGQVYILQKIDELLVMGHHRGAFIIDGKKSLPIYENSGAWTFTKLKNHPEYIIGGTYKGLELFKKTANGLEYIRKLNGLVESSRVIEQDIDGQLWMTHGYKGAYKIKLNENLDSVSYSFYNKESGFPTNNLINVWKVNNRLIFSSETSIFRYDDEADAFVPDEFFANYFGPEARISYLEQDALGNIYYISPSDIGVLIKLPDGTFAKQNNLFYRLLPFLNDDLQKLKVLDINRVLYAAKEGFILFSKTDSYNSEVAYPALVRRVTFRNNGTDSLLSNGVYMNDNVVFQQPENQIPKLDYAGNSISIEYTSPFTQTSVDNTFSYRLKGLDDKWSDWTSQTFKEYTNLHEGTYTFEIMAKNSYGINSSVATYQFRILPPWYRTTYAYLLFILVGISLFGFVYFLLDKRHKHEKRMLSINKQIEINKKDDELRTSEAEIQRLKNEKLITEVEMKNKELGTSTMLLLNKNGFINSVKHNISTIIKRSKNQEVKKELAKIMTNIDKNIAQDDDWQQFSLHFDQVHGDFTRRLKDNFEGLTPQEIKLSAYLRMNLSTKEIAHLLNISVRGVEIARYRLRKKLLLDRSVNLQEFILKY